MWKKYYWIGVIFFMLLWFGPRILHKLERTVGIELQVKASPMKMRMFRQLTSAYVALDSMPPEAEELGITEDALLSYLQQWFRQQGVKTISEKQFKKTLFSGKPAVRISVNPSIYEENGKAIVEL